MEMDLQSLQGKGTIHGFGTPRLQDSQTPGLPDSGTPKLRDSQTPGLPDSQGVLGLGSSPMFSCISAVENL